MPEAGLSASVTVVVPFNDSRAAPTELAVSPCALALNERGDQRRLAPHALRACTRGNWPVVNSDVLRSQIWPSRFSHLQSLSSLACHLERALRHLLIAVLATLSLLTFVNCGAPTPCTDGSCADGGLVINELAGSGGDFVELFNASDTAFDLSGFGLTDMGDAGIRYATSLRFETAPPSSRAATSPSRSRPIAP